jgi:hypothetical protein
LFAQPWAADQKRFDVVTAFEVLYYIKDIPKTLDTMSRLGKTCIATYYGPAARRVEQPLMAMPILGRDSFKFGDTEWRVLWWK